jgi:hypothetical protein
MNPEYVQSKMMELFGSREGHLAWQLITLSEFGQPCDVTFYNRKPIFDVRVSERISTALMYGAGAAKLQELLSRIEFSDGTTASFGEIWTINPMPKGGILQADLDAVDMSKGEQKVGSQGETMRQIIRETYHCASREEEDRLLRRFIAS